MHRIMHTSPRDRLCITLGLAWAVHTLCGMDRMQMAKIDTVGISARTRARSVGYIEQDSEYEFQIVVRNVSIYKIERLALDARHAIPPSARCAEVCIS